MSDTPEYDAWVALLARCSNPSHPSYANYGGRGIGVSTEWHRFDNFIMDMGRRPSAEHSIDRMNNDEGYSKENCRWITIQEQQKNRRNNNEFVGIRFEADRGRWRADITNHGRKMFLGRFVRRSDAIIARTSAETSFGYAI